MGKLLIERDVCDDIDGNDEGGNRALPSRERTGVLCVTGQWGVGKTFLWRSVLDDLRALKRLSLTRYSYVSLFGLNSLDDIKSSLFENMEWLDDDATTFAQRGKAGAKALAARAKKLSELAGALPWVGQLFTKARSLYFSLIENQIVCIDDLDRRSKTLEQDALGLISFLREQRGCKVALLLNADKLGDKKDEFEALLEKVVEVKVVLAPTAADARPRADAGRGKVSRQLDEVTAGSLTLSRATKLASRYGSHLNPFSRNLLSGTAVKS